MKVSVERQPGSLVMLDITADTEEFAKAMDRAFRRVSKDLQIPGFRKGKAPRGIIERYYGREIFVQEAADDVMDTLYRQALQKEDITPVGEPDVEIVALEPVNFKVTVPVYPSNDPGDYTSVRVEPQDASISEDDVNEVLERLQTSQATWVDPSEPRKPQEGDQVTVDYQVKDGDEDFQEPVEDAQFVLGETNLLTQLRERIEDMNVGDTETFDLVFDEDDETADPSIRGKALTYTVTLKGVKERELAELDDEFAKSVADAASLEDLKQQIRDDVHQGKTSEARTNVVNEIINKIAEGAEVDPPAVMIDEEVEHQLNHLKQNLAQSGTPYEAYLRAQGKTEDEVKQDLRPDAERRLRNSLLLQEIARREEVEVTDDDINAELDRMLGPISAEGDEQQQRLREMYRSDYFKNMIRNDLFERKLTDHLISIATEGRGAVLNGWEPNEDGATAAIAAAEAAEGTEATSSDDDSSTVSGSSAQAEVAAAEGETDMATDSVVTSETADPDDARTDGVVTADTGGVEEAAEEFPALEGDSGDGWVKGDGETSIPEGYPVKGNAGSRIYHTPDSRFYDNTVAEYYFASPEVAESYGFRAPKGAKKAGSAAGDAVSDAADEK
ncbi:MAG TPA: trigger factor [Thermomicrobiales bacterium]|nr:trigger factor [Thermomicrobiales bacterium]